MGAERRQLYGGRRQSRRYRPSPGGFAVRTFDRRENTPGEEPPRVVRHGKKVIGFTSRAVRQRKSRSGHPLGMNGLPGTEFGEPVVFATRGDVRLLDRKRTLVRAIRVRAR